MYSEEQQRELVAKAIQGDQIALQKVLVAQTEAISRFAASRLPRAAQEQIDPDDIVQQTFIRAFRSIDRFRAEDAKGFQGWLLAIADHVIKDAIRAQQRLKRGGNHRRLRHADATPSRSVVELVEMLSAGIHSPSYSAMGHEAVNAVQQVIGSLPDDYRQAIELRLLQGKSLDETADIMSRTPRAVQGLVDRAKKKMREALETLSNFR